MFIHVVVITSPSGYRAQTVHRTENGARMAIRENAQEGDTINLSRSWLID